MIIESLDGVGIMKIGIFEISDSMSRLKHFIGRLMSYSRSLGSARVSTCRVELLVSRRIEVFLVDVRACLVDASLMEFSPFSLGNARVDWAFCIGRPVAWNLCFSVVFPTFSSEECKKGYFGNKWRIRNIVLGREKRSVREKERRAKEGDEGNSHETNQETVEIPR